MVARDFGIPVKRSYKGRSSVVLSTTELGQLWGFGAGLLCPGGSLLWLSLPCHVSVLSVGQCSQERDLGERP